ncbi:MAG: lysophospholipid acyltransferase family protein [Pirellulales bacterium]
MLRRIVDYLVYLAVRVAVCAVQAVPLSACRSVAAALATLSCDVLRLRRGVIEENLAIAFGELSPAERRRMAWRMWEHLFLMVAEIAHAPRKLRRSTWRRYIRVRDLSGVVGTLLLRRPKVIVAGHYGNFELSGYVVGLLGFPTFTVARTLDNPHLDRWINGFRSATGQYMLSKHGSSADIDRLLEAGASLTVLGDQAAGPKGCWVDFFGRPASTHKAVAVFALANDAPLIVGYARRIGGPLEYEVGFEAVLDPCEVSPAEATVPAITLWYSQQLETIIRQAPEQYWWVHRRWKGEPPRRKRRAA